MKSYFDRLRECPVDYLHYLIKMQENRLATTQRVLESMKQVLKEREDSQPKEVIPKGYVYTPSTPTTPEGVVWHDREPAALDSPNP